MGKPIGYLVMESCDDYEQALQLLEGETLPRGGILAWATTNKSPRAMFASRSDAMDAINRTEHYRLAFGHDYPKKCYCSIVPIASAATPS